MQRRTLLRTALATAAVAAPSLVQARSLLSARHKLALTLPLTGVQAEVAKDLQAGYELAVKAAQRRGTAIELVVNDDAAAVPAVARAVSTFAKDKQILAVSGIVGTPHAIEAVPLARAGSLPVIGLRSGAQELRTGEPGVFHLRSSYEAEIDRMFSTLVGTVKTVGVIYSLDAFGKGSVAYLRKLASHRSVEIIALPAERNGKNIEEATDALMSGASRPAAVLLFMIAQPMCKALQTLREKYLFMGPCMAMSFTATREIALTTAPWSVGLGIVSAFPLPRTSHTRMASSFRTLAIESGHPDLAASVTGLEGYFYGATVARAIERTHGAVTRESLVKTLLSATPSLDVVGVPVAFDNLLVGYSEVIVLRKAYSGVLRV